MSKNNNSFIRYKALDRCFRDNIHRYFIEDLISECEKEFKSSGIAAKVSRRQIFDDIRFMESEEGWGIKLNRLKDGKRIYYRYEKGGSRRNSSLTEMETMQLKNAINTLDRFRAMPGYEWVSDIIVNLECRLGLNGYGEEIISFETKGKGVTKLPAILDAILNHKVLEIRIEYGYKRSTITMHPYYVKQSSGRLFVFGYYYGKNKSKAKVGVFDMDRITKLNHVDDVEFVPNTDIDYSHRFDDVLGVRLPRRDVKKEHIILQFDESWFKTVYNTPIHYSQKIVNKKLCRISLDLRPTKKLISQLLYYGSAVEVRSPESLKSMLMEELVGIAAKYKKYSEFKTLNVMHMHSVRTPKSEAIHREKAYRQINEFDFRFNHGYRTYDNPISLFIERPELKTPFLRSYPIDKIVGYVRDYFRLGDKVQKVDSDGDELIIVRFPNVESNCELVKKALRICGCSLVDEKSDGIIEGTEWKTLCFELQDTLEE